MESGEQTPKKTWDWKKRKPNNMLIINSGPESGFFRWWCIYMLPMVKMTPKEIDVVSNLLYQRWELSKVITDPAVLDSQLMSNDTLAKVIKACKITRQHFYVLMSNLRKNKIVSKTGINPRLLPNIPSDSDGTFQFLVLFKDPKNDV